MMARWKRSGNALLAAMLVVVAALGSLGLPPAEASAASAAKVWGDVGNPPIMATGSNAKLATVEGILHTFYMNEDTGLPMLQRYAGNGWETAGAPVPVDSWMDAVSLAVGAEGDLFMAYMDGDNEQKATMRKLVGGSWEAVGDPGFTDSSAFSMKMTIAANGTPYVAYRDRINSDFKASVKTYDGADWNIVGTQGFGSPYTSQITVAASTYGTPYVAYADYVSNNTTLMVYEGSDWEPVGQQLAGYDAALVINGTTPYVAYADGASGYRSTVKYYNGSDWVTVGDAGFSVGRVSKLSLAIDGDVLYVAYTEEEQDDHIATVMAYDGVAWAAVGNDRFPVHEYSDLAVEVADGVPYVAFTEKYSGKVKVQTLQLNPPVLSPPATGLIAGQELVLTFPDDATWRSALTSVKADGAELVPGADYTIGAGAITIEAGVMRSGLVTIAVAADGYAV